MLLFAECHIEPCLEECHDKTIVSVVEVPQEVCDLNPVKTWDQVSSTPQPCTRVPTGAKRICVLKFSTPQQVQQPLLTKCCLDPAEPATGQSY